VHDDEFAELRTTTRNLWGTRSLEAVLERRADLAARQEALAAYAHRSGPQDREHDQNSAEIIFLDELAGEKQVEARRSVIARGVAAMADPANCERPDGGTPGAPALIGDRRRPESAADVLQRMRGNPWRDEDGGPLAGHTTYGMGESGPGLISRCHDALSGLEPALTHDGAEKLAQVLAESSGWPGMTVKRSRDEAADAARLVLALSNPHYLEAFRSVLRYPMEFTAGGTGFETMTPE
jgi:hypothetical protein